MKADQDQRGGATPYRTSTRGLPPPLVTTKFVVQDDGTCVLLYCELKNWSRVLVAEFKSSWESNPGLAYSWGSRGGCVCEDLRCTCAFCAVHMCLMLRR